MELPEERVVEEKCRNLYNQLKFNHDQYSKYNNKFLYILLLDWFVGIGLLFGLTLPFNKTYLIIGSCSAILALGFLTVRAYKQFSRFTLTPKETLIIRLCGIANYLANFIQSEAHTEDIRRAKSINNLLIFSLNPARTPLPNLYAYRGFYFEDHLLEFVHYLKIFAKSHIQVSLEGKRDYKSQSELVKHCRFLAYFLYTEQIEKGCVYFIEKLNINMSTTSKIKKFFSELAEQEVFRWFVAIGAVVSILVVGYIIAKTNGLISTAKFSVGEIFGGILALIPGVYVVKAQITDRLLNRASKKK